MDDRFAEIVLVDDDPSLLSALGRQVDLMGYKATTFADPGKALDYLCDAKGDCLLVDLSMPGMSGLELQASLSRRERPLSVVFLSAQGTVGSSVQAIRAGALDFLVKPVEYDTLRASLDRAVSQVRADTKGYERHTVARTRFERLSEREGQVFRHVIQGQTNKTIARCLDISERTVKAHRASIMTKLEADTVADMFLIAAELDLLTGSLAEDP